MPLAATPARLPAKRGLQWLADGWHTARAHPRLWLAALAGLVLLHAMGIWLFKLFSYNSAIFLPVITLATLPPPAVASCGTLQRPFASSAPGASLPRRLMHALVLTLLLTALLLALLRGDLWLLKLAMTEGAAQPLANAALTICTPAAPMTGLLLTFWILLAQALAACGQPLTTALARSAQATWRNLPALCVHAIAFLFCFFVEMWLPLKVWLPLPLTLPVDIIIILEMLITPWLMARDMFSAGAE